MTKINFIPQPFPLQKCLPPRNVQTTKQTSTQTFGDLLAEQTNGQLKISKHASNRLNERNIHIDEKQWAKISAKVQEAKAKGVNESLVLLNNAALIVSAKNATVITAMDLQEAENQLFTNINGAIVLS
ncbi:TIGR02530 family flagellar biosynthesis protein [Rummeliibacillus stabekisii]|uniref:TIGR02530 family flagellar biosynthesis protein n=1 Tax=Rummeliibacillus stabekisii TaxID=241244 RepID=UPI003715A644